ncbi:hypothetical protein [Parerythrobacter jejuensis]|uniref:DUF2846 domain-containing protein n=1 Tax=Parerythrobacter jejuensis TaxID=795812 RepID=A0A845ASE8_9SPHN|nr:hypothetical protein [Parerythrobacter jejuensis]MXP31885.1 hypothetical protein [Parerythrobacter jejuensis]
MDTQTRNWILIGIAIVIGGIIGISYPTFGLLLLIPVIAYIAIVLMRNKGGSEAEESVAAEARRFTADDGKGAIYVMRKGFIAGQQGMNVTIDNHLNTQFRTGRFVKADVEPGEHTVAALMGSQTKGTASDHTVSVGAGECVLLDAQIKMGALQGTVEFHETRDAAEARSKLAGLKLVEWPVGDS